MYAARYGLSTGIIEQMMGGAQIINLENAISQYKMETRRLPESLRHSIPLMYTVQARKRR